MATSEEDRFTALLEQLNDRVFKLLGLRSTERWLVQDFVHLNLELNKGKVTRESLRPPTEPELKLYLTTLRDCLDCFLSPSRGNLHRIEAITDREFALFSVSLKRASEPITPTILAANENGARTLVTLRDRLGHKHSQWVYFDRNLKIYERGILYQFKPMQRLHWTRRQAVLDSDEIIAETVAETSNS